MRNFNIVDKIIFPPKFKYHKNKHMIAIFVLKKDKFWETSIFQLFSAIWDIVGLLDESYLSGSWIQTLESADKDINSFYNHECRITPYPDPKGELKIGSLTITSESWNDRKVKYFRKFTKLMAELHRLKIEDYSRQGEYE
jgi:hypothetical protein